MNLFKSKEGIVNVQKDKINLICPFIPPMVQANMANQHQLIFTPCSSNCAHFNCKIQSKSPDRYSLNLGCGSDYTTTDLEMQEEKEPEIKLFPIN